MENDIPNDYGADIGNNSWALEMLGGQLMDTAGEQHYELPAKIVLAVVYAAMITVCVIFDTLMICVVCLGKPQVRSTMNLLLANLALSDLLAASLAAPFFMHNVLHGTWVFGAWLCAAAGYLKNVSLYVSTNSLMAISIHRTMMMVWPLKYVHRTSRQWPCVLCMVAIWAVSSVIVLPTVVYTELKQTGHEGEMGCMEVWPLDGVFGVVSLRDFHTSLLVLEFVLPVLVMLVCHSVIATIISRRRRQQAGANRHRDYRAFRLLLLILLVFIICWSPFYGEIVWKEWWTKHWQHSPQRLPIYYFVETLSMSNAMFNAIFNIVLNDEVKSQAGQLFAKWFFCPGWVVSCLLRSDHTSNGHLRAGIWRGSHRGQRDSLPECRRLSLPPCSPHGPGNTRRCTIGGDLQPPADLLELKLLNGAAGSNHTVTTVDMSAGSADL